MKLRLVDIRSLLAAKRTELAAFGETLTDPILSAEQKSKLDSLEAEIRGLEEREERQERLEASIAKNVGVVTPANTNSGDDDDAHTAMVADPAARSKPHVTTGDGNPSLVYRGFTPFADQLHDVRAIYDQSSDPDLREKAHNRLNAVARAANESVDSQGGYLVQKTISSEIQKLEFQFAPILEKCKKLPLSDNSNALEIPFLVDKDRKNNRFGGVTVAWTKEGKALEETKQPDVEFLSMKLKKIGAYWEATDEVLRHNRIVESLARDGVAMALAFKKVEAVFSGLGTYGPKGFMSSKALIKIAKESGQAAASLLFENIVKMNARLWPGSQRSAVWYVNPDVLAVLPFLKIEIGLGGQAIYLPSDGAAGAPLGRLYGKPVELVEHCQTLGTLGDIVLVDFTQYGIMTQGGLRSDESIHVKFLEDKHTFRFIEEMDGAPLWEDVVNPVNGTQTLSPFIALNTRA